MFHADRTTMGSGSLERDRGVLDATVAVRCCGAAMDSRRVVGRRIVVADGMLCFTQIAARWDLDLWSGIEVV